MVLTTQSSVLRARQLSGEVLTFTNIKIGDGLLTAGQTEANMTALNSLLKTVDISSIERINSNQVQLEIDYSNEGFTSEKYVREFGIFAKIGNEPEVLYAYENTGSKYDTFPAYTTSDTLVRAVLTFILKVAVSGTTQVLIDEDVVFPKREEIKTEVLNLLEGTRNISISGGGNLTWGVTANKFMWDKQMNIYPGEGRLLYGGLNFKEFNIAPGEVTMSSDYDCAYITIPDFYTDVANKKVTVLMSVGQASSITGTDKLILFVRDVDDRLIMKHGILPYGSTFSALGEMDNYIKKSIFTATNDFVVGTGSGTYAKKTLAESKVILGISNVDNTSDVNKPVSTAQQNAINARVPASTFTAANDFVVGTGSGTYAKKTLAETKTILGVNASTSAGTGVIQLATSAEVTAGTDTGKAVTPATLKVELDKKLDDTQMSIDGTMASNSDSLIPSQKAAKTYIDTKIANLINNSPTALDTLNELAAALANDPNFATTMTNALAGKIDKSAYTASGDIVVGTGTGTYIKKTMTELKALLTLVKGDVGLGNVDNTSDVNKPVSTAQQNALNTKIDKSAYTAAGDILVGTGAGAYVKKTLDEIRDLIIAPGTTMYVNSINPLPGFIKKNGALLSRTAYANLWAYAQASGNIVDDTTWNSGAYGSFSTGDGSTTFRIPDERGYFDRAWDDGRGIDSGRAIGSSQVDDTKSHAHTATETSAGGHTHSGTTSTTGAHTHDLYERWNAAGGGTNNIYASWASAGFSVNTSLGYIGSAGDHAHTFSTDSQGAHTHTITVNATGGTETRGKNIAKLAIIKY